MTNKKRFVQNGKLPDEPVIISFWHGELLTDAHGYLHARNGKKNLTIMAGTHKDAELIARFYALHGFDFVRGSSSKGAIAALKGALGAIKNGFDIAISPDGPRGPRHGIADGIVYISQKTNCQIVPLRMDATKKWTLNSWDKFIVPKPFGEVTFKVGEPFGIQDLDLSSAKTKIQEKMAQAGNI